MSAKELFAKLKHGLIVSCQAEDNDPFNTPDGVTLFARAAEMGGAAGIRSCGIRKTEEIIKNIGLPVIGITKAKFDDGYVKITRSAEDVEKLFEIGCSMVAIDGTMRFWDALTGPEFIAKMKEKHKKPIMADISCLKDAIACADAGADCVSTTLVGYTAETEAGNDGKPDLELIRDISQKLRIPLIAEGRISSPEDAKAALDAGAFAVVVGTVITRPRIMTMKYIEKMKA